MEEDLEIQGYKETTTQISTAIPLEEIDIMSFDSNINTTVN